MRRRRVRRGDRLGEGGPTVERIDAHTRTDVAFGDAACSARVRLSGPRVSVLRPSLVLCATGPRRYGFIGPRAARGPRTGAASTAPARRGRRRPGRR
ncbi:hypothetical protein [Streptomyces sp. NPDC056069]|uniref:hypothetical protein n=1 Tax=Streptomyces sp. NPDC056069 TaxID=3345702 RepID=UPI0035D55D3B